MQRENAHRGDDTLSFQRCLALADRAQASGDAAIAQAYIELLYSALDRSVVDTRASNVPSLARPQATLALVA